MPQPAPAPLPRWLRWGLWACLAFGALVLLFAAAMIPLTLLTGYLARRARAERRTMAECKSNLKGLYTAEKAFYQEKDRYSEDLTEIGFNPERQNRFAYFISTHGAMEDRSQREVPQAPDGGYQAVGVDMFRFSDRPWMAIGFAQVPQVTGTLGVTGTCPDCQFTAACVGNLDPDPTLHVWSISSLDRVLPDGGPIPSGQPFLEKDDLEE